MSNGTIYERKIRDHNGVEHDEACRIDDSYFYNFFLGDQKLDGSNTPKWWEFPTNLSVLVKKYEENGEEILPITLNVVTFVTYMNDGRMQLQQRSYVSPQGNPINNPGDLSINGGGMESDDVNENLCREAFEELGVVLDKDDYQKVGDVYDANMGRTNHVFRVDNYESLLIKTVLLGFDYSSLKSEASKIIFDEDDFDIFMEESLKEVLEPVFNPEGVGRAFFWREDLEEAIANKNFTDISVRILIAFPELMPPYRP